MTPYFEEASIFQGWDDIWAENSGDKLRLILKGKISKGSSQLSFGKSRLNSWDMTTDRSLHTVSQVRDIMIEIPIINSECNNLMTKKL